MTKTKEPKPRKVVKIANVDLKDLIRDSLYAYACQGHEKCVFGANYLLIPIKDVRKIAKRIAQHAIVGH